MAEKILIIPLLVTQFITEKKKKTWNKKINWQKLEKKTKHPKNKQKLKSKKK